MATDKEFFTVKDLAEWLQVNEQTIYRLERRGDLLSYSIGRAKRFRREDVEAFLQRVRGSGGQS